MKSISILLPLLFCILSLASSMLHARESDTSINTALQQFLVGDWCLNKEEYLGDISYSGDIWSFYENGNYEINSSETPYTIIDESIKMEGFGTFEVSKITENEMVATVYSTYYFSKPRCSEVTLEALKLTQLNNAILLNNIEKVRGFIKQGIDVSKSDLRSGMQSTPLMLAIKKNNIPIVKLILEQKPDLTVKNYLGKTVLDLLKKDSISDDIREMINNAKK